MDYRKAFENWYSDDGKWPKAIERNGNSYKLAQANLSWEAWEAASKLAYKAGERQGRDEVAEIAKRAIQLRDLLRNT